VQVPVPLVIVMSFPAAVQTPVVLTTSGALELPPPGVTVNVELNGAVPGTPVNVSVAWLILFTVSVAAADVAGEPHVAVTITRYCEPLSVPLTEASDNVGDVAPLTFPPLARFVKFAPLSVLTCHW